jgi:hypothetical protein
MEFWKGFADGYRGAEGAKNASVSGQLVTLVVLCVLGSAFLAARHGEALGQSDIGFWSGSVLGYFLAVLLALLVTGGLSFGVAWLIRPLRGIAPHVAGFLVIVLFLGLRLQS